MTKLKADSFTSPITHGVLRDEGHQWVCEASGARFPVLGGVPWLTPDARLVVAEWKFRALALVTHYERVIEEMKNALHSAALPQTTRRRIEKSRETTIRHVELLRDVLAPLKPQSKLQGDLASAFGYSVPVNQALQGYFPNLVRDWFSINGENEAGFAILKTALGSDAPGTTLFVGSGGGRLAYDFHQSIQSKGTSTFSADINPILTYSAKRIFDGDSLEVCEFASAPRDLDAAAGAVRTCRAPVPSRDGLHCLFADAFALPFADGSLQTVITPWLVDIVPHRFEAMVREINRVLKPGGSWVNTGSFNFKLDAITERISPEEGLEVLGANGFEVTHTARDRVLYLKSDLDSHERYEWLFTFRATKKSEAPREQVAFKPEWLRDATKPVQAPAAWQMQYVSLESQTFVLSLIDGRRGIADIVAMVAQKYGLSTEAAGDAVVGFLRRLYEETLFTRTS